MTTPSTHLGIAKPTTSDDFSTAEIADNWEIVDQYPGVFLCTQSTRPVSWGSAHEGMLIYEQDRNLYWRWDGAAFVRAWALGWLNGSQRTSDLSSNLTTPVTLVSASVDVPVGGRRVQISTSWGKVENDTGISKLYLYRDSDQLQAWQVEGDTDTSDAHEKSQGGSMIFFDAPGAGTFSYALKFSTVSGFGGTSWGRASGTTPICVDAVEV